MMLTRRSFLWNTGWLGLGGLARGAAPAGRAPGSAPPPAAPNGLVFETVRTDGLAHLSYLFGDKAAGVAAVLDPRRDVEIYLELARKHGLRITHVLETHIHADFVSGSRELADRARTAKIHLSAERGARYGFAHEKLRDGDRLELGRLVLTAVHTPGHTPEHLSFLAAERGRLDRPWGFFSGDFLFAGSVGRPDLLGAERTGGLARQLFRSLRTVLPRVKDDVRLYPAHGAGSACGANICDRQSTVGLERKDNPALQFTDEAKFIDWVLWTAPPIPRHYPRLKKVNARGPAVLKGLPDVPALQAEAFRRLLARREVQLLDNRDMLAFGGGHIPGALNVGPRPELSVWAGWLLDPGRPLALVLPRDGDLPEVVRQLIRVGFTHFAGYLAGGIEGWATAGLPLQGLPQLPVQGLKKARPGRDLQVLDVRSPQEWEEGHVPGAKYLFLPDLEDKLKRLDRRRPVAVYCASGYRSSIAASLLQARGFARVHNVPGSWTAWAAAGFPAERPRETRKASDTDR
jgi:hydroxyacylglutathione hydrolase